MEIYVDILIGLQGISILFTDAEDSKYITIGLLSQLPVYGRILGWW